MASVAPPQTHSQPSRKGKRAWRKNVDITDIQSGIETAREEQTLTGGKLLADVAAESLFQTDTVGSTEIQRRYRKSHPPLRSEQIIAQRSAIPPVNSCKRSADGARVTDGIIEPKVKRRKTVPYQELVRLRQIAYGGESVYKDVVEASVVPEHDPWAVAESPEDASSFLEKIQPIREPKTLKRAPVSLAANGKPIPHVRKPNPGRSYNPAFYDWIALLEREGQKEVEAEKKRLREAEEEQARLDRVAAAAAEAEKQEEREGMSDWESEWEGIQSELDETQLKKKRPERKTQAERNRIKRRKEAERLSQHEASMKRKEQQARHIALIKKSIDAKEQSLAAALQVVPANMESSDESDAEEKLRRRRFGRWAVPNAPLELLLADELQDSLRLLKPEGNLLTDRYRKMLVQGRVEVRKPIQQPKMKKVKATEKWSYKDWTLESRAAVA